MVVDILNELTKELAVSKEELIKVIQKVGTNKNNLAKYLVLSKNEEVYSDNGFQVDYTAIMMNEKDKRIAELKKALELACEVRDDWGGREYDGTEYDNYYDYFTHKADEELKI